MEIVPLSAIEPWEWFLGIVALAAMVLAIWMVMVEDRRP
jgi:hypothetical protein